MITRDDLLRYSEDYCFRKRYLESLIGQGYTCQDALIDFGFYEGEIRYARRKITSISKDEKDQTVLTSGRTIKQLANAKDYHLFLGAVHEGVKFRYFFAKNPFEITAQIAKLFAYEADKAILLNSIKDAVAAWEGHKANEINNLTDLAFECEWCGEFNYRPELDFNISRKKTKSCSCLKCGQEHDNNFFLSLRKKRLNKKVA